MLFSAVLIEGNLSTFYRPRYFSFLVQYIGPEHYIKFHMKIADPSHLIVAYLKHVTSFFANITMNII